MKRYVILLVLLSIFAGACGSGVKSKESSYDDSDGEITDGTVSAVCEDIDCGDHGICFENGAGEAECSCDSGYHEEDFVCVENDSDDPCSGVTCSGHGYCVVTNDEPVCICQDGYRPEGLNCVKKNTGDTGDSGNTGNTGDSGDTANTADSGDTSDSGNTANSGDSGDTADSADSGDTGNVPPEITGQDTLTTEENTPIVLSVTDFTVNDPDNIFPNEHTLHLFSGTHYTFNGQTVTPENDYYGTLAVAVKVRDGTDESPVYYAAITVTEGNTAPTITGQSTISIMEEESREITTADLTVSDPDNTWPDDFTLTVYTGSNYSRSGTTVSPNLDYTGDLSVPVRVHDGEDYSPYFYMTISVENSDNKPEIAVVAATSSSGARTDVQDKLLDTDMFASVDLINAGSQTPTLADLADYNAILVFKIGSFNNNSTMGDVVADYVDIGGGVVVGMYAMSSSVEILSGRFNSDDYWAISPALSSVSGSSSSLGTVHDDTHPIMDGVVDFNGGSSSARPANKTVQSGADRIADWADGTPLIATRIVNGVRRVDLGFVPTSSDDSPDYWDVTTDGDLIMANSLLWVAGDADIGDIPEITGQEYVTIEEDGNYTITLDDLTVSDSDNVYPDDFTLSVDDNSFDYSISGNTIYPDNDFAGTLYVPVTVNDGTTDSPEYDFEIVVNPVNDPPECSTDPQISGTATPGNTLTVSTPSCNDNADNPPDNITYTYTWQQADDSGFTTGVHNIKSGSSQQYSVGDSDVGTWIRVKVTVEDDGSPSGSVTLYSDPVEILDTGSTMYEDFSDGTADDFNVVSGNWSIDTTNNYYHASSEAGEKYASSYYNTVYDDFELEIRMRKTAGTDANIGIYFRGDENFETDFDWSDAYTLIYEYETREWTLQRVTNGWWEYAVVSRRYSDDLLANGSWNVLKLVATNNSFTVYFNGVEQGSWTDNETNAKTSSGVIGFKLYDDDSSGSADFDYISITSLH